MRLHKTADAVLVAKALNDDRDAFAGIVRRYQSLIYCLAYTATGSPARSEELAHDVFVTAWTELGNLREPDKLKPWLCGIARNRIREFFRVERRNRTRLEPISADDRERGPGLAPSEQLMRDEDEAIVWRALQGLPDQYRQPLVLYYREQESVAKVAEALDLSTAVVRQRLSRGRRMLRKEVLSVVERTLRRSVPSAAFTAVVLASLSRSSQAAEAAIQPASGMAKSSGAGSVKAGWLGALSQKLVACGALVGAGLLGLGLYMGRADSPGGRMAGGMIETVRLVAEMTGTGGEGFDQEIGQGSGDQAADPVDDLKSMYREGVRLERRGSREEAGRVFRELEGAARDIEHPVWIYRALWKQAQAHSRQGHPSRSRELYAEAFRYLEEAHESGRTQFAGAWSLLGNRITGYLSAGFVGEAMRLHFRAEDFIIEYLGHGQRSMEDQEVLLAQLYDDPAVLADRFGTIDSYLVVLLREAQFRHWGGEVDSAIELIQKVIDLLESKEDLSDRMRRRLELAYFKLAPALSEAGHTERRHQVSARLIALGAGSSSYYHLYERIRYGLLLAKEGGDAAALLPDVLGAHRDLNEGGWHRAWLASAGYVAALHAKAGDPESALGLLREAIAEAREVGLESFLAALLLARAEINIDLGRFNEVEEDLLEALAIARQIGLLRLELCISETFGRYLLRQERLVEAHRVLERSRGLAARLQDQPVLRRVEDDLAELLTSMDEQPRAGQENLTQADLQPLMMTTGVAAGEIARGRFLIVNPSKTPVTGRLIIDGARSTEANATLRRYRVAPSEANEGDARVSEELALDPYSQLEVILSTPGSPSVVPGDVVIEWESDGVAQRSVWEFGPDSDVVQTAVVNASVAMESPFYPVPLYHEIYHRGQNTAVQNLRVVASHPARIELVDLQRNRVLAIDAQGNGKFDGPGDAVFRDRSRDGYPDLVLSPEGDVSALEVFVFPDASGDLPAELTVQIELMREGEWEVAATNILLMGSVAPEEE